jgi:hypothetical protein
MHHFMLLLHERKRPASKEQEESIGEVDDAHDSHGQTQPPDLLFLQQGGDRG